MNGYGYQCAIAPRISVRRASRWGGSARATRRADRIPALEVQRRARTAWNTSPVTVMATNAAQTQHRERRGGAVQLQHEQNGRRPDEQVRLDREEHKRIDRACRCWVRALVSVVRGSDCADHHPRQRASRGRGKPQSRPDERHRPNLPLSAGRERRRPPDHHAPFQCHPTAAGARAGPHQNRELSTRADDGKDRTT